MNKNLGTFSTKVFAPYLEWTLENDSISGNAYDLNASVTFTHKGTGEKITTGMFYDGDDYNFRFTGTKAGEWTFQTSSGDADLNGYSGTINVAADSDNRGFVVAESGKFAQQISDGSLEAILPNMAMMTTNIEDYYNNKAGIKNFVQTFIVEHGFTGVHIPNLGAQLFDLFSNSANYGSSFNGSQGWDPDPRAFEVLENIITEVHAAGGIVHIWPWGDNARDQTPDSMPGGENGYVHDRIMEYMADRLGALPGWTLGYGFDNYEWTTPAQAAEAARYFNSQSGWEHLTSVRGGDSVQNSANHSGETRWHEAGQTVADYEHHQPTYEMYVAAFQASDDLAVQSGDRFRVRDRSKDFTQAETVDNLWISTIAGGASGIYGNLTKPNGSTIDTNEGSLSYTQAIQNQIATWNEFFIERGRFELDSARANYLTGGASNQQYALESKSANHVVVYAEDTNSITLNLGKLSGDADWSNGATVIAVNTEAAYQQTNLGSFDLENQTISLSSKSDWALFVRANTSSSGGNNTGGGDDNSGGSTGGGSTGGNNTAPNASYDRATVVQGETVRIDVLANDSDSNGDTLTVQSVDGSPKGTVSINAAGKVVYVAPTDWSGRDTFSYTISDGNGGTDTARIDVDVSKSSSSSGDSGGSSDSGGSTNTDTTTPTDATPIYTLSQKSFSGTPTTINPITLRGDFTIMGTIEFKEDRPIDNRDSLVGDGNYWNGNDLNFYDGKFRLYSSGKKDVVVADTVAEEGGEAHYAIVRKDGITKLFVNGQLEDKATTTWNANFVISEIGGGVQDGGLGGTISDLKIYNEFLTNKEVAAAAEASLGSSAAGGSSGNVQADTGSSDDTADDNSSDDSGGNSSDDSGSNSNSSSSVDLSDAVFTMLGQTEFGGTNSIVSVAPSGDLRVDEATISMFFEADNVSGTKSLLSKDATGYSGGDHLRARIENGELIVRFQNEDGDDIDISAGNVSANKEYHLGITFGDWGARVFLDGELVGFDKEFDMDWLDNIQYLHVGGDGSAQSSGSKTATNPFDGTISDLIIFDDQYGATKLNEIIDAA